MSSKPLSDIENVLENNYNKLPNLPQDIKELIVTYLPYLILLGAIFALLSSGLLSIFTILPFTSLAFYNLAGINYVLGIVLAIVIAIVLLKAYKPLQNKKKAGWRSLYYLSLIIGIYYIILFDIGGILSTLISFYFLFQIKTQYS